MAARTGLQQVSVGVGWEDRPDGASLDLDIVAFALAADGRVESDGDFVFFNNLSACDGAIRLTSDAAVRPSWREELIVDAARLPARVERVTIAVVSYGGERRFAEYPAGFVELSDSDAGQLARIELAARFGREQAVICADLYRDGGRWILRARGDRYDDLAAMARSMGVKV
ncbi:TerD family protein [Gordonia sp. (in: high G+C Gram-positive bacteria)]|uniref:TerD family protein n=1 Tax=Gordonia sp. (in: high G+C Gram-positive bacteria) TaxID=84139 RepID=UPI0039E6064A